MRPRCFANCSRGFAWLLVAALPLFADAVRSDQPIPTATGAFSVQFFDLGMTAVMRGQWDTALSSFRRAAELAGGWAFATDLSAHCLVRLHRDDEAAATFSEVLRRWPQDLFAQDALLLMRHELPDMKTEAAARYAGYVLLHASLSELAVGDLAGAIQGAERAVAVVPSWSEAHSYLGYLYQAAGQPDRAKSAWQAALSADPAERYANFALKGEALSGAATAGDPMIPTHGPAVDDSAAQFEQQLVELINGERSMRGLRPLEVNSRLVACAREHSAEMRDKNYFDHISPTPGLREPYDRVARYFSSEPRLVAENIARRWGSEPSLNADNIRRSHTDLMNSPGHRRNILNSEVTLVGVGIATNAHGDYWITELFMKPAR